VMREEDDQNLSKSQGNNLILLKLLSSPSSRAKPPKGRVGQLSPDRRRVRLAPRDKWVPSDPDMKLLESSSIARRLHHFIWLVSSAAAPPCSRPYFSKAERPPAA
jgi:hypothetical protein